MRIIRTTALLTTALAFATPALAQQAGSIEPAAQPTIAEGTAGSQDVIVTAQRREQTLMEVPQAISVVSGEALERQQATSFQDYVQLVPGLSLSQPSPGSTRLVLRGINTGSVASTVAVYVDDVPFGQSGGLANGGIHAGDVDTFDIARLEVLKGPQGTLYGSNSLGGVLKFITAEPRFDTFEGRGQSGVEFTKGGGTGYFGNAMINIPLGDTLAVRASGFYRKVAGYVDVIGRTGGKEANEFESYGGRASVLFKPVDNFSVRLFGLLQNLDVNSPSTFTADPATLRPADPISGQLQGNQRTSYERLPQSTPSRYRLYSGTVNWDLGFAGLTSVTSYAKQFNPSTSDITYLTAFSGLLSFIPAYVSAAGSAANLGLGYQNDVGVRKFTQELRLASSDSTVFEWLIGGYYTRERTFLAQRFYPFRLSDLTLIPETGVAPAPLGGQSFQNFITAQIDAKYKEYAGFGSGTLHLGPRFDLTAGGRYSRNEQSSTQSIIQFGLGNTTNGTSSEGVFTWSVAPRFELNDRASIYARAAKGYRPGGPTFIPTGAPANYPTQYDSDSLVSYEAGFRGETADRTFGIDVSAFYIDWDDIQIVGQVNTAAGPATVNTNGRRGRSYGVEATGTLRPTRGLSVIANFAYTHARLRDDTTPTAGTTNFVGGLAGDPLPYTPSLSASLSADYEWRLSNTANAFVGGNVRVVGDQTAFDTQYRTRFNRLLPINGYQTVDLRAGVDLGGLTISAYVRNLTNEYAIVNASYGGAGTPFSVPATLGGTSIPLATVATIPPRTVGASVGFKF